jgi:predicted nucleic acid-binding protein
MRVVLDTNVLVSAALKQQSMPGMTALLVERRGGLLKSLANRTAAARGRRPAAPGFID